MSRLTPPESGVILIELMSIAHDGGYPDATAISKAIDSHPPEVIRDLLLQAVGMLYVANNRISEGTGKPVDRMLHDMRMAAAEDLRRIDP